MSSEIGRITRTLSRWLLHTVTFTPHFILTDAMYLVPSQGKMCGVLEDLVSLLGEHSPRLVTYAGGASSVGDLDKVGTSCCWKL